MYPKKSLLLTLAGLTYALLTHCWRQIKICTFSVDVSYMMYKTRTKTRKCIDVDICQCNIHVYITSDTSFGLIRLSDGRLFIYMQAVVGVSSGCSETEKIIHVFIWICVYVQVSINYAELHHWARLQGKYQIITGSVKLFSSPLMNWHKCCERWSPWCRCPPMSCQW